LLFWTKRMDFFWEKMFFQLKIRLVFFEKINQNFNTTKWKMKPWSRCRMSGTRCISAILGIYVSFIPIRIGRKTFFLLQFVLLYLKWYGQSIKYYCPSWREGWTSLVSSHIGYLMDNSGSNTYSNFNGT
jgi:hypothetical protein